MLLKRSSKAALLLAASVLWAGGAAAQVPGSSGGAQQPPSGQQPMPGQTGAPGVTGNGMPDAAANAQPDYGDQAFVHDTMEGDEAQVQMSQLAVQKSSSPDVKQFGQKMVQIHTQLNQQLDPVARQMGVNEPKEPSKKAKKEVERLQALSGPDFDTAYIQAMARQQQHDLKGFKNEAQSAHNPSIQQAARMDEPILAEHYQVLEQLAKVHNVTLESKK